MADHANPSTLQTPSPGFGALIALLAGIGLVSRALPLFQGSTRLLRQFPTEDGYLMLTIARNMALGRGMSTAAGTMPTNGTQPLMTSIYSLGFRGGEADRATGVAFALCVQLLIAILGAWLLYRFGRRLLESRPRGQRIAALAAAVWFASGISVKHSMNCLETGAFAASVLLFTHVLLAKPDPLAAWSARRSIGLGALLGLALWARIDAVFLVLAACLLRWLIGAGSRFSPTRSQFISANWMGATAVMCISPWLIFNQLNFGSVMPVSGRAEASFGSFASNLSFLPVAVAEYFMAVVPVPARYERHAATIAVSTILIVLAIWACLRIARHADARVRALILLTLPYALGLCIYYGLFFGAQYFLSRYMFPLAAFAALLWTAGAFAALGRWRWGGAAGATLLLALVAIANFRIYRHGREHMHFQVVEWIEKNVDEQTWVGAIQTGTIGFFHDRSINLDGKVNPAAHAAALENRVPEYLLGQPIQYLADWAGIASWAKLPALEGRFVVVIDDPIANLGVLRRVSGP